MLKRTINSKRKINCLEESEQLIHHESSLIGLTIVEQSTFETMINHN